VEGEDANGRRKTVTEKWEGSGKGGRRGMRGQPGVIRRMKGGCGEREGEGEGK